MTWITGAEILEREGWGGLRLRQAFDKGELCPYRTHDEARFTAESKCFRCVHAQESYCAIDCLKPGQGRVIDTIVNLRKQGVPQVRGAVDKDAFRDGFPTTLFDHPIARNDSEFLQFIEDKIGPENLRAMLAETLCHREADDDEKNPAAMLNRLRRARYKLNEVEAYECLHRIGQVGAVPEVENVREQHTVIALLDNSEKLPGSPEEYAQQLKSKRLDDAEIKYRLYHNGKKSWKLTWWKVHCIVEGLPYPPKGNKGEAYRTDYKDTCLRQIKAWRERF